MKRARLVDDDRVAALDGVTPPRPGELVRVDGLFTCVRRTPARATDAGNALYIHGLGGSSVDWTDLAQLLSPRLDGEAIDLPGFGHSDPAVSYSQDALAQRVVAWIEHSGRAPVHLFGNSLGGAVAIRVAARRPDLVATLTLISPALPFIDLRKSAHARLLPLLVVPRSVAAKRLEGVGADVLVSKVVDDCFAEPASFDAGRRAEAVAELKRRYELPWFVDSYLGSLRGLVGSFLHSHVPSPWSMWSLASRITAPTLVITGHLDRLVDIRTAPAVAQEIPDSRLLIIDRVGHVAQLERPRLVARAVLAMLDEAAALSRVN